MESLLNINIECKWFNIGKGGVSLFDVDWGLLVIIILWLVNIRWVDVIFFNIGLFMFNIGV